MDEIMRTASHRKSTILQALMTFNGLGASYNKRLIRQGVVQLEHARGVYVYNAPNAWVDVGDVIRVGKHQLFTVVLPKNSNENSNTKVLDS